MYKRERTARSRPGPKRIEFARTNNIERQNSPDMIREFITEHSCTLGKKTLWSVAHRKYKQMDADGNGTLDRDELASLMKERNGSKTVSEDGVDYLFKWMPMATIRWIEMNWRRSRTRAT